MAWYKPWRKDDKDRKAQMDRDAASAATMQSQILEAESRRRATETARLLRSRGSGSSRPGNASVARGRAIMSGLIGVLGSGSTSRRTLGGPV